MTIIPINKNQDCGCGCGGDCPPKPVTLNLPVAPTACARTRFSGVEALPRAIPPMGAISWIEENLAGGAAVEAINISGPGDPLADIAPILETLRLIREKHPKIKLGLTTTGVHGEKYAKMLAEHDLSHVILLVDAVDPDIAQKLYAWIRPAKKTVPLPEAAALLVSEQQKAVSAFKQAGCAVTIRTSVYPGYNDNQIEKIAETMAGLGAAAMTLAAYRPEANQEEETPIAPDDAMMARLNQLAGRYLISHIAKESAKHGLGKDCPSVSGTCKTDSAFIPKPSKKRPNVAVASLSGMDADLHLGQADKFLIYGPREDGLACLLTTRPAPEAGSGDSRWQNLAESLGDCFAVLASGAGSKPRTVLADAGITVLVTEDEIEGVVDVLYGGGKKKKKC